MRYSSFVTTMNEQSNPVASYIAAAPKNMQAQLRAVRAVIKEAAPSAVESISYGMPGYDKGRVGWFALRKDFIGLYLRPPIIAEHSRELAGYETTKSAIHFPLDKKIPVSLIKKLIKARIKRNQTTDRAKKPK
jgi:uncharacterized protein YdhG (YjbR/CyaY superfamily)